MGVINNGSAPNDGTGDAIRDGAEKINQAFIDYVAGNIPLQSIVESRMSNNSVSTRTIVDWNVTNAKLANMAQATIKGRASGAGTGPATDLTAAQVAAIASQGGVTVDGANVTNATVTNAKLANMPASTIKGSVAGGTPGDLTAAQVRTIIGDVSSATAGLAPASGGGTVNFLRADGTWAPPVNNVLATQQATTSGTFIDFTGIPSWVKFIRVMLRQVSTNGASGLGVQIGTSGGLQTSGYNNSFSNDIDNVGGSTGGTSTAHFYIKGSAATNSFSGSIMIYTIGSNVWVSDHVFTYGSNRVVVGAGDVALSGTLDRLRLLTSNGTDSFDAGSVNIMYE